MSQRLKVAQFEPILNGCNSFLLSKTKIEAEEQITSAWWEQKEKEKKKMKGWMWNEPSLKTQRSTKKKNENKENKLSFHSRPPT